MMWPKVLLALLGWLIGVVVNWLADWLPERTRWRRPFCPHCGQTRPFQSWSVLVGYLISHGRCPQCGKPWPLRHVLVELLMMVLSVYVYLHWGFVPAMWVALLDVGLLVLTAVTDLEHRLVFNVVVLVGMVVALGSALLGGGVVPWRAAVWGGAFVFLIFYLIALVYPSGMDAGDVKLAAWIGTMVGWPLVVIALLIGILAGGIGALALLFMRRVSLKSYIPYGPFLILGALVTLFYGGAIVSWYLAR